MNGLSFKYYLLQSFIAGCFISFGALLSLTVTTDTGLGYGLSKLLFGAVFPLGLILTVLTGAELFTGNVYHDTTEYLYKSISLKRLCGKWIVCWCFNFIGALFIAVVIVYLGGLLSSELSSNLIHIVSSKLDLSFTSALLRGVACNWLVCLGVYLASRTDKIIEKIICIWIPVMAFATMGFEHSIANMFMIPLYMISTHSIDIISLWGNLVPVTIGNIIGGGLFVACVYFYSDKLKYKWMV